MRPRVHWPGFLALLLLSPVMGELLSGSAPPAEFFSPLGFLILIPWYGIGAILCRELSIRWRSGLAGLFLLGMAFGILEEGILIKTFFDPNSVDLGILQAFGWWGGANWPWILELTLYHAVVSITLPVLVVSSLWPDELKRPWLSLPAIISLGCVLALMAVLGWFLLSPAQEWPPFLPGSAQFLGALLTLTSLCLLARSIRPRPGIRDLYRRWTLFLAGFSWGIWLLGAWAIAEATRSAILTLLWTALVGSGLLAYAYLRIRAMEGRALIGAGTVAAGAVSFWSLLAIIQELDNPNRADDTSGMALVGILGLLVTGAYLVHLGRQWRWLGGSHQAD
ncbi:hypothetical protein ACFLT5_03420 [Chloroflexota bacterium]